MATTPEKSVLTPQVAGMRKIRSSEKAAGLLRRQLLVTKDVHEQLRLLASEMDCHVEDLTSALTSVGVQVIGQSSDPETRKRLSTALESLQKRRSLTYTSKRKVNDLAIAS